MMCVSDAGVNPGWLSTEKFPNDSMDECLVGCLGVGGGSVQE